MSNFAVVNNNSAVVKIRIQVLENSDVGRWEMMRVLFCVCVCVFFVFFCGWQLCVARPPGNLGVAF
jgi:Tfp pilus assembly protein PilO